MAHDQMRREEFLSYFNREIKDRQRLIDCGVSKGRITQYFDPDEPFGERAAHNLEKRLQLPTGVMFPSLKPRNKTSESAPDSRNGLVPVVGTAQLGDNGHFYDLEYPVGHGDGAIDWPTKDGNAYALRCRGESMKPRIRHNEYVIVEPGHPVASGDEVLVKAVDGRVMVKQLAYTRDGMVHLDSVNEAHPRISLLQAEISVMHYVAAIAKQTLWRQS
jgi:phage repressor protein C with HTH and peptisase S24 domain